jgi:hypothetical protein
MVLHSWLLKTTNLTTSSASSVSPFSHVLSPSIYELIAFSNVGGLDILLFILSIGADIFYLLVYVDDILLTGNNLVLLNSLI